MANQSIASIASTFVLGGMEPLRLVVHHEDGSWDFLCNTTNDAEHLVVVHAGEMFRMFSRDLKSLQSLPAGYLAERENPEGGWQRDRYVED